LPGSSSDMRGIFIAADQQCDAHSLTGVARRFQASG
jgi:hypothetical protein